MALQPELRNEIASISKDPFFPIWEGLLRSRDYTLLTRGQGKGLWIYEEIERDPHAYAVLQKRKMAVVSRPWRIVPGGTRRIERQAADLVERQLKALNFDYLCLNLLDGILKGFAVGEVLWQMQGAEIVASRVVARDQRRFTFLAGEDGYQLRLLTAGDMVRGQELPDRKFIVHSFGAKDDSPFGLGLGSRLFFPVYFKRQGTTFWMTFCDKFGTPTAVGEYPTGASLEEQRRLLGALGSIAQDAGIIVPQGTIIKLLEASRSGAADTYEALCRYMDEQVSEAVLGETLTTNLGKGGSFAASQTHNAVRLELVQADADLLSATLNRTLVRWISELNFPGVVPPQVERDVRADEDMKARAERDQILVTGLGLQPTPEYLAEHYPGWVQPVIPPTPPAEFAERLDERDVADDYTDQAAIAADQVIAGLVGPVRKLVAGAASFAEIRDGLERIYPDLNAGDFASLMERATLAATLAGRFEVGRGS